MALTGERLRELLTYDPESGCFTWRTRGNRPVRVGAVAGCLNHETGYWRIKLDYRSYFAHRLVWLYVYGRWPRAEIDHINGIRSDNRLANLREASSSQNKINIFARRKTKLGARGVRQDGRKFEARVGLNGAVVYSSRHDTLAEAKAAYAAAAQAIFGEFAGIAMNYASLVGDKNTAGSIARWVNYAKLDGDVVLAEAQAILFQTLRVREMRTLDTSITASAGDYAEALPANFLDPICLRDANNNRYDLRVPADLMRKRQIDGGTGLPVQGQPIYWSVFDEKLQFEVAFNAAQALQLLCFKSPALLSGTNQANFLTNRYPHLLRKACVLQAWDFMRNETEYAKAKADLEETVGMTNAEADLVFRNASYDTQLS